MTGLFGVWVVPPSGVVWRGLAGRSVAALCGRRRSMLASSIIIIDDHDWSTAEIVQFHLGRWQVEHASSEPAPP